MIRKMTQTDEDFIYHSWIHTIKNPCHTITDMTRMLIDDVVSNGHIRVYCSDEDQDHIIGWIAYGEMEDTPLLHMLFVKRDLRSNGVGKSLFKHVFCNGDLPPERRVLCTHWSKFMNGVRFKWNIKYVGSMLAAVIYRIAA